MGGVVCLLLPKVSTGIILGGLFNTMLRVVLAYNDGGPYLYNTSCLMFVIAGVGLVQKYKAFFFDMTISLAGSLALAISIGLFADRDVVDIVVCYMRMESWAVGCRSCRVSDNDFFAIAWAISFLLYATGLGFVCGRFNMWVRSFLSPGEDTSTSMPSADIPKQQTFSYPDNLEYNYFDPDAMPHIMRSYSELVFAMVQEKSVEFGFQIDNSRNQAEHLLMLLSNEVSPSDLHNAAAAPQRLHKKMFKNYVLWCDRMGVIPLFSVCSTDFLPPANLLNDMLIYLLVWGESANLKHMPECMCYIYHKSMGDHFRNRENYKPHGVKRKFYHGYFLDMTVTPMYNTIQAAMKGSGDHKDKKTYDDFNEFFWSPECLQYPHHLANNCSGYSNDAANEFSSLLGKTSDNTGSTLVHVAHAMKHATKTYVEKRSWLHSLLSFHRVVEWHLLGFTLSAVWAFREVLVWSDAFTAQIGSVIYLMITFMHIIWTTLEVWRLYPTNSLTSVSTVCGYVLRLTSGYVILVYQAMYYYWSFLNDDAAEGSLRSIGGPNFWWWQYIWLSMIALSTYLIQSLMCWFPFLTSKLMTSRNDLIQAVLNICYPLSELYVGKKIHVPEKHVLRYILFWLTLLSFKLWFGFVFIVSPLAVPSIEMYDQYMNFENVSVYKTVALILLLWVPHLLVYFIDLSIWFSVWAAFCGGFEALIHRQGAVRNISSFQSHFMRLPQAFCHFLMPLSLNVGLRPGIKEKNQANASCVSLDGLPGKSAQELHNSSNHSRYGSISDDKKHKASPTFGEEGIDHDHNRFGKGSRISSPARVNERGMAEGTPLLYQDARPFSKTDKKQHEAYVFSKTSSVIEPAGTGAEFDFSPEHVKSTLNDFLSDRSQRWVIFSKAWNLIIDHLRGHDHMSDNECEIYKFSSCEWFSKPVYLPLCITAGCIDNFLSDVKEAATKYKAQQEPSKKILILEKLRQSVYVTTMEALMEAWELLNLTLFTLLGPAHNDDLQEVFNFVTEWVKNDNIYDRMTMDTVALIANHAAGVVSILNGVYNKRRSNNVVTEEWLKTQSAKNKTSLDTTDNFSPDKYQQGMKKSWSYGFLAGLEDETRLLSASEKAAETAMKSSSSVLCLNEMGMKVNSTIDSGSGGKKTAVKFAQLQPVKYQTVLNDVIRDKVREELRDFLVVLRNSFRAMSSDDNELKPGVPNKNAIKDAKKISSLIANILTDETGFLWEDVYASKQVDAVSNEPNMKVVLKKLQGLFKLRPSAVEPSSDEAKRRIYFFVNSLFMKMPLPPSIAYSKDFTCITPYYSEDVLLTPQDLLSKNSDGVSTILYLQTIYALEWKNFLERRNITDDTQIWNSKHVRETRMWASLRAQTLFRTVEGMMNSEAAVRFLAECESLSVGKTNVLAVLKFNYVIACQIYGTMKRNIDHKAEDIEFLLSRHPNLRVAYIDTVRTNRDGDLAYYSVLIKLHRDHTIDKSPQVKEIYRVKLPGNPILGEGKPENQNHALIFSRGRYIQAIDMNQDGYFEEALKFRNLLEEFENGYAILGFREHIFTGEVSSVANYMALQEKSFVTLGQRVLYSPLRVRQHYGHPDLFDKMYVMTKGGMSKASRGINLSEDVYSGFNATIRGESVGFQEYIQVGKGRDVGLQQTYKFEAKLAQGNAEQSLSRDMNRICDRLDFFRLLSFYYGGIGHYIANTMVMCTLFTVVYIMLVLALYHCEGVNGQPITPEGLPQLMLAGMGILQTLPLMATLTVEKGVIGMLQEIGYMIVSGGPLYFIFHIQTKCYYFQQTLLAGGAMYRPTGRGFVIRHSPFDENFRFFASSHLYSGFEIMIALILIGVYTESTQYFGTTWSLWLIVLSFLFGPFWFNPVSFEWNKVLEDYSVWLQWMWEKGGRAEQSWHVWFTEETEYMKKISISWRITLFFQRCFPLGIVGFALSGTNLFSENERLFEIAGLFLGFIVGNFLIAKLEIYGMYAIRRLLTLLLSTAVLVIAIYLFASHLMYIKFAFALYYVAAAAALLLTLCGADASSMYKIHDYVVGHFLFLILLIFAVFQVFMFDFSFHYCVRV